MDYLNLLLAITKSILIALLIVSFSYFIEKLTGLKLFFDHYKREKSPNDAKILSDGDTGYYIILNIIVLIVDIVKEKIQITFYNITLWLGIIIILSVSFHRIHRKYQNVNPNMEDGELFKKPE